MGKIMVALHCTISDEVVAHACLLLAVSVLALLHPWIAGSGTIGIMRVQYSIPLALRESKILDMLHSLGGARHGS